MTTYFWDVIFNHYADFEGRATRTQFWLFQLWMAIFFILLMVCMLVATALEIRLLAWGSVLATLLFMLGIIIPNIAIHARRLHDINFSGWWLLLWLIGPGNLIILIFCCLPTVDENNEF